MGVSYSTNIIANIELENPSDLTVSCLRYDLVVDISDFTNVETIEFNNTVPLNFMDFIINNNLSDVLDYLFKADNIKNYKFIRPSHFTTMSNSIIMTFINNLHDFTEEQIYYIITHNKNLDVIISLLEYANPANIVKYVIQRAVYQAEYLLMLLIYNEYAFSKEELLIIAANYKYIFNQMENDINNIRGFASEFITKNRCNRCNIIIKENDCIVCRVDRLYDRLKQLDFEDVE